MPLKRPREEPTVPGNTGYKVKSTPGSDDENKTYTFKHTVTGRPFLKRENDVNVLSFHHPDIHLGSPGKYVLELDRVDLDAYCADGSVYRNGMDAAFHIPGVPYWMAWPNFNIRGTTADETRILLAGLASGNMPTPIVGTYMYMDRMDLDIPNIVPAGMYMVTRAQRSYVSTINTDFAQYAVDGNMVTVPVTHISVLQTPGTPPTIPGATLRLNAATGYPAGLYRVVACTGTSLTFDFGSPAPTPVAAFVGDYVSYVEVLHGLPYTPGPFTGMWEIIASQYNFVNETRSCLTYTPEFTTTMAVGRTFGDDDRTDSKRVVLGERVITQPWDALGVTTLLSGTKSAGACCTSFGKGNGPTNGYRLKQSYSNPWATSATTTQGAIVPFDTLSFQLRVDDSWVAQDEPPRFCVTKPEDFLVDKTYHFTLRPYFL